MEDFYGAHSAASRNSRGCNQNVVSAGVLPTAKLVRGGKTALDPPLRPVCHGSRVASQRKARS
jgi:hypothetical protein